MHFFIKIQICCPRPNAGPVGDRLFKLLISQKLVEEHLLLLHAERYRVEYELEEELEDDACSIYTLLGVQSSKFDCVFHFIPREIVCVPLFFFLFFLLLSATIILEAHFRVVVTNWSPARYITSTHRGTLPYDSGMAWRAWRGVREYVIRYGSHKNGINLIPFQVLVTLLYYLGVELQQQKGCSCILP